MLTQMVQLFEADSRVAAYSVSDAANGPYGDLTPDQSASSLTQTGKTYLAAVESASGSKARRGLVPVRR
jgi:predicted metal-binding protein